ncbi:TPA: hypothetical protein VA269_001057 [Streptococcus agalactiae]|uniref:hypothetical protein n=1 Tax=Streptococcus agalactiae TaxID=1311 RepID=UPI0013FCFD73|nr:hypothetical protein [Streptococcus agalactiae]HEN2425360.1 hypothetical protein [Streptococcus agalactiae]HEN2555728.1 hypothetical protein [Streptococcus agalactiae]HEN2607113.1 hypothetical protein [Streptococcus agalactiae]HEO0143986.1 hypothetical protein [Streptococcus agalactiae]HEO0253519.1 hypothetical protein [Streptococcus agalactiae]
MKEKTIFISKKYANDFNNDKYNLSSGYYFRNGKKHDIAIVKYGEKDYLKNTDLAYVVCDKIVDEGYVGFVYHGEYETWHFKLLNTGAN